MRPAVRVNYRSSPVVGLVWHDLIPPGHLRARTRDPRAYAAAVREQIGWQPVVGQFTLFIVEVADVTYIRSEPGTDVQLARWPRGEEYIRPLLTPTSLGLRQAVSRLLTPDS
jgi:hypothetical protein